MSSAALAARSLREDFPRRHARTRGFTLGAPRSFTVAPDGSRVAFLRSPAGDDPVQGLWVLDVATGEERCVADPRTLAGATDDDLPREERARRERARERAGGIVRYATDRELTRAAFSLGSRVGVAELDGSGVEDLGLPGSPVDPRLDPAGDRLAWVADGRLRAAALVDGAVAGDRELAGEDDPDVTWGLPDFVAAEEIGRTRRYWWSPDGRRIAAARVDVRAVRRWHVTDPAEPSHAPQAFAYPAAGTPNADVSLTVIGVDGGRATVHWDQAALPYLANVSWRDGEPLTVTLQSRDQRRLVVLTADPDTGATETAHEWEQLPWIDLLPGLPRWLPDGRLLAWRDDDTRRLVADGEPLSPDGLQIRRVVDAGEQGILVVASDDDPTGSGVWRLPFDGGQAERLTPAGGSHSAAAGGRTIVITSASLFKPAASVVRSGAGTVPIRSLAEDTGLDLRIQWLELGERRLRAALLLPGDPAAQGGPLPVLLDPYGGPHAQRVVRNGVAFGTSQWFADQGFAVLVADGRGTPGRGPAWEHAVAGDLATAPLEDQVDALHAAAERYAGLLDLDRVAIRGWSFGGYLAALAVLRRPDVFRAAIAGAPVTDWRLYDTHYTERYLGHPDENPEAYRSTSLVDQAPDLERPLLLIHGLADDNVVAAHTLRLSRALLEAGRPHQVLPLAGVTHMTPQETVAENLLRLQLAFLSSAL